MSEEKMKQKEIYVCVTLYHVYLTLLLINKNHSKERSFILLNANDKQIFKQFGELEKSLRKDSYKVERRLRNKTKDIVGIEEIENYKQYKSVKKAFNESIDGKYVLYNFAWNCQYVYTTANLFYKKCAYSYFMEEGALTAINPPQSKLKVMIKRIIGASVDFYKDDRLVGIYVQQPELYPESWKSKLKILDTKALLESVNTEERKNILNIFLQDACIHIANDTGIVYTQPLSEDGYIDEDTKIKYFQEMCNYYKQYGKVICKIHPRDMSKYDFGEDIIVWPGFFPSEILNLIDVELQFAVGICTSAVPTTNAKYKLNLNTNYLNDLKFELILLK
jgi:hypothetical protein